MSTGVNTTNLTETEGKFKITIVDSAAELQRAFSVLKELRTHLQFEEFLEIYEHAQVDQYKIAAIESHYRYVAVMGYRVLHDCVHGKHLYVDDLVTTHDLRGQGFGAQLLKFAESEAGRLSCTGLRLCTGAENEAGKRFYEREGWTLRALVFKKKRGAPRK